jgi:phage FluMu gp28-like protein
MAEEILDRTLEHDCMKDEAIRAIVQQLKRHPTIQGIMAPIVSAKDFQSCFKCVPEKTASSYSGRSVLHYKACADGSKYGLADTLAEIHAAMATIPLETEFCPERWRFAVDIMLDKIPGIARTNKLRIIQLLEADLNQVWRAAFARNITKLAQNHEGVISEHQYVR